MAKKRGPGEGSIYKMKDGRWRAAVDLGWREGKRVRKVLTGKTYEDVQRRLVTLLAAHQGGYPIAPQRLTIEAAIKFWLAQTIKPTVRYKTFKFYESLSRLHIVPAVGRLKLQNLRPQHVQALLNDKLAAGLSARTCAHIRTTLISFLNQQVRYGAIPRNVAALTEAPRGRKPTITFLTPAQARTFLEAAADHRLFALFAVTLSLGLRLGEALGLGWDDVDLDGARARVIHSLQYIEGEWRRVDPKSAAGRRTVILPGIAVAALHRHRVFQDQLKLTSDWKGNPWNLVFTSLHGTPLFERNTLRAFKALLRKAGLPPMRLHDLRHSAVAILIAQGVSPRAISELIGHSSVAFTLQVYGHLMEETRRETADKMDAALSVATPLATFSGSKRVQ